MEKPLQVFCCYARNDQEYLYELKKHLMVLQREKLIEIKADIDISPGTEWEREIGRHLDRADIILLLISADFVASDYCFDKEMQQAIERHKQGTARVVPVIIRPTAWRIMPFSKLQALPKDATAVISWQNRDEAWTDVTEGIRKVVEELETHPHSRDSVSIPADFSNRVRQQGTKGIPNKITTVWSKGRSSLVIGIISGTVVSILIFGVISTFALLTAREGTPGTILYQADWSQGMDGWSNTPSWSTLNGILINDGTGFVIHAAYQPSVSDYAVEAEMRIDKGCRSNGVIARAVGSNNYGAGAVCWSGIAQISEWSNKNVNTLGNKVFAPGNGWHKYRLELKGNILRLLIDGVPMIDVIDDTILTPGLVGLWSGGEQLEVRSFTVYSL